MATGGRVAQRRWRVLLILATHGGWYTTADIQALIGVSPMTVHRDVTALRQAGLLQRQVMDEDRSHRWMYAANPAGARHVADVLRRAGLDVPANLGRWAGHRAIPLLVLLSEAGRLGGDGHLLEWRSGADVASWLRHRHGIDGVQVDAYGVWAEGDRAIRFLVLIGEHLAQRLVDRLLGQLTAPEKLVLPVNAVLLVADTDTEEKVLHQRLRHASPAVLVATVTQQRLHGPDGPAGAIWVTSDGSTRRLRLIELADAEPVGPPKA